ncbi:receptor-like protein 30 [Raphanus sativus]|uniref:Receptor-like protein 30 n=1 Tax=Raphanus sativus TaxID=3726 RepID=A0A6J0KMB1_RAPSA|nr:receptor-like protein 30 [Raphanus sativus]
MKIPNHYHCLSGIFTLLFLIFQVLHSFASPVLQYCRHDQRDALLEFKHEFSVNKSNSILSLSSWNKSSDCCSWEGVMCDAKSGHVLSLYLDFIPLNNSLKPDSGLFKLHHLRNLTLSNCNLSGELPSSLGNLSHLTKLHLSKNHLVGEIPASLGNLNQLRDLSLDNNQFSGNIPFSFANYTKLSHLIISNNHFTGEFPLVLLNLSTSLSYIVISDNLFKSTLPSDMSQFQRLKNIDMGGNSFFGYFPTSLFMNPLLGIVSLRKNQFKGPIEFRNASSFSKLLILFLQQNKFNGPIPKSISKFSNLKNLDLHDNSFTGSVPNLPNLEFLDLSYNKLEGEIPGPLGDMLELMLAHNSFSSFGKAFELSDLTHIQSMDLSSNSLRGPLPSWICKLRPLLLLDLSKNSFGGSIPQCLKDAIVELSTLNLQNNNLSGILPPDIFVNATNLVSVDISGNQLEGKLPKSLINCVSLEFLNVKSNRIKDVFPSWLGSLPSLDVLILRENELYGPLYHPRMSIGFQSLKIIDLSRNHFNGTLPPFYFANWSEITNSTKRDTEYMGDGYSTNSMEMVNKGVDMLFELIRTDFGGIDFSGNNFSGKIPESIGLLKGLRILNLSSNGFTSSIPQSLANLTNLEALDLSRNQLSGRIPQNLARLSFLSIMNFSRNDLQGPIPRSTQFERQNCSAFMDNPRLYGLEDICGKSHVPNPTPQEREDLSEPKEQVISWISAVIAYVPGVFCGLVIGHIYSPQIHKWFM